MRSTHRLPRVRCGELAAGRGLMGGPVSRRRLLLSWHAPNVTPADDSAAQSNDNVPVAIRRILASDFGELVRSRAMPRKRSGRAAVRCLLIQPPQRVMARLFAAFT